MLVHWNTFLFWCQWKSICSDETVVLPKTTKVGKHCSRQHQQTDTADNEVKNASVFQLAFNIQRNCMRLLKKHTCTHARTHRHTHTETRLNSIRQFMTMAFHMSMLLIVPLLLCINKDISQSADTPRIYMTLIKWIRTYVFSLLADTDTNHSRFLSNHTT